MSENPTTVPLCSMQSTPLSFTTGREPPPPPPLKKISPSPYNTIIRSFPPISQLSQILLGKKTTNDQYRV